MTGAERERRRGEGNSSLTEKLDRLFSIKAPHGSNRDTRTRSLNYTPPACTEMGLDAEAANSVDPFWKYAGAPKCHLHKEWNLLQRLRDKKIIGLAMRYKAEGRADDFNALLDIIEDRANDDLFGLR